MNPSYAIVDARYRAIEALDLPPTLPATLERAERLFGDATAVDFFERGTAMSFRELRAVVRRLAHGLEAAGIGAGDHVAVLLPNRIEFAVTWLALAEIGAVMATIVLGSTAREIGFVVEDSDATALVTEAGLLTERGLRPGLDGLPPAARTIVVGGREDGCLCYDTLVADGDPDFVASRPPGPDSLLNVQYTSGTSGLPKGAMLTHRFWVIAGVVPGVMWGLEFKTILSDHPFFYIDPQWMLVCGLYTGARVDFTERMSVSKYVDWLADRRTELAWFADPVLDQPPHPREAHTCVKLFLGYEMGPAAVAETAARFGAPVREAYGMTEIGMGLAIPLEDERPDAAANCGIPAPFRRFRIVDEHGGDVPDGVQGELWVGGEGILSGYYKRQEATAEALVDGWFRTGDVFVRNADGEYRIVGRLKDMVRRSGESIAAAEVEAILMDMPGITEAAIVPVPDKHRGEEIKAYIVPAGGAALTPAEVLDHCRTRLAKFKLPRYVAFVGPLPRTASDKVAKKALVADVADLRVGAFDTVDQLWR